jgi:phospholipid/cholesterol/gamma-HCH transport system substrate-binding protein
MNERTLRFRIGLFLVAALILLGALVTLFGSLPSLFTRTYPVEATFSDAGGVGAGTPVRRSGVRIGEVQKVDLDDETGLVRVRMLIDRRYTLRHNEQPTVVNGLLGGDTAIDFVPRPAEPNVEPDRTPIQPNEQLTGARAATVNTLVNQASQVVPTTQDVLNDIRKSLQNLEKLQPLAEATLKEYRDLGRAGNKAMPELMKTNDEVRELAKAARETIPDLRRTNDEVQAAARTYNKLGERLDVLLQANQDKLVRAVDNLNDVLVGLRSVLSEENQKNLSVTLKNSRLASENLPSISKNTDEGVKELRTAIKKLNDTLTRSDEVFSNLQTATRPLAERAPAILKNMEEGTGRLNKTLADLQEVLKAVSDGDGTLRRFVSDPSLYQHLDEAAIQINRILPRVDRVLKDFETFADKLARHPESIGLGGVVRPSSGLKDAPPKHP